MKNPKMSIWNKPLSTAETDRKIGRWGKRVFFIGCIALSWCLLAFSFITVAQNKTKIFLLVAAILGVKFTWSLKREIWPNQLRNRRQVRFTETFGANARSHFKQ